MSSLRSDLEMLKAALKDLTIHPGAAMERWNATFPKESENDKLLDRICNTYSNCIRPMFVYDEDLFFGDSEVQRCRDLNNQMHADLISELLYVEETMEGDLEFVTMRELATTPITLNG